MHVLLTVLCMTHICLMPCAYSSVLALSWTGTMCAACILVPSFHTRFILRSDMPSISGWATYDHGLRNARTSLANQTVNITIVMGLVASMRLPKGTCSEARRRVLVFRVAGRGRGSDAAPSSAPPVWLWNQVALESAVVEGNSCVFPWPALLCKVYWSQGAFP